MAEVKYKLWISPGASSLFPHIILREAHVNFDLVIIDVTQGGFPAEHKPLNPKGRIPMLEFCDDGTILTETTAIATYAALLVPTQKLLGATTLEIAQTYEWLNWLSGTVHERGLGATFSPGWYTDDTAAFDSIRKKCMAFLVECFGIIENKMNGLHAVGDKFTIVDVFLYVIYRWGNLMGWDMPRLYPKWTLLVDEVIKRDSVKVAVATEGIPLIKDDRIAPDAVKETASSM